VKKMDIHNLTAKDIKKLHIWLRALIQILYFLFIPSVYTAAFAGVKYIFTQIGAGGKVAMTTFVTVLVVICIYTILFGRFFCGFACAFGTMGDGVHALYVWICKKMKKKPFQIAEAWTEKLCYLKYIVLALISILCFAGVYSKAKGTSPWDVFSMLHAGNFKLDGYLVGLVLLVLILAGMCFEERFFCRNFCPMGAVFSLLPILPLFALHRDRENCIKGCKACTKKCPSNIGLPEDGSPRVEGDCFQCQKCIDTCPKGNIHTGVKGICGNEFWFTILRAAILLALLFWLGV
jgi:polyferredoxin